MGRDSRKEKRDQAQTTRAVNPLRWRKVMWVIVIFTGLMFASAIAGCGGGTEGGGGGTVTETVEASGETTKKGKAKKAPKAEKAPEETPGQENARRAAESYLETAPFSRKGLIRQLKFEGYSEKDATYAVDAVGANWNEQAAKAAQSYLDTQPFSRSGLIRQLKFEGFTTAQATYGVNKAGL